MATKHTFEYVRNTVKGIEKRTETRDLTARTAIKYNCLDCVGGFSKDVRECDLVKCPLWVFRPYQNSTSNTINIDEE